MLRGVGQAFALDRGDALIALHAGAGIDRHREMTAAQQHLRAHRPAMNLLQRLHAFGVELGVAAHALAGHEIGDHEGDRAGALDLAAFRARAAGLDDELALEFQRVADQRGDQRRLAHQARDGDGIVMGGHDGVGGRAKARHPAADGPTLQLENRDYVVAGPEILRRRRSAHLAHETPDPSGGP